MKTETAKLQSNHHYQQNNSHLLQTKCPSCRPTNSAKALKGIYVLHASLLGSACSFVAFVNDGNTSLIIYRQPASICFYSIAKNQHFAPLAEKN